MSDVRVITVTEEALATLVKQAVSDALSEHLRHGAEQIGSPKAGDLPRLLTLTETAALLRRSNRTIRRWVSVGLLKTVRSGGGWPLVSRSEIERMLRER